MTERALLLDSLQPVRRLLATPMGAIGSLLMLIVLGAGLGAPFIAPYDPFTTRLTPETLLQPPSAAFLFGTDNLGRDVLSRTLYGLGSSLAIAFAAVGIGVGIGTLIGAFSGLVGGWTDRIIMRLMDALLAFPVLVLAIAVSVALGRGPGGVIVAVAFVNVPVFARLARGQTLRIRALAYMSAARIMGCGILRQLFVHVLPNMLNPIIVQASVALSFAVLIEAGLSFLGLGIQAPTPSLGLMIAEAKAYLSIAPHLALMPSLVIVAAVVALNMVGDAIAAIGNPHEAGGH